MRLPETVLRHIYLFSSYELPVCSSLTSGVLPLMLNAGMNTVNYTQKDTIQAVRRVYAVSRDCPPADLLSQVVRHNSMQLAYFGRVTTGAEGRYEHC